MFRLEALPHREAIEYFESKGYAPADQRFDWRDTWREEHARDWVVAKAMRDDVSREIRQAMAQALKEGRTLAQFQAELAPKLQEMGWWGRRQMQDPQTGEFAEVQLGSMRRLRVIFNTNMRTAHAAGRWAAIQRTKTAFPYLEYVQIDRPSKRPDHARFDGKIWAVDDPVWLRLYPPNGWFCGCHVLQRTEGWMRRNNRTADPAPDLEEEPWTNKRTGEVFQVPKGVFPGFDTNPGATWLDIRARWREVTPDLTDAERADQLGILEGLRLERLARGVESLVILDRSGAKVLHKLASAEKPAEVHFPRWEIPAGSTILHSHITDSALSTQDLLELGESGARSITAITPGGAIWRAIRLPTGSLRLRVGEFARRVWEFFPQLKDNPDGQWLYSHALARWLEKEGVIAYHLSPSARVRQILERNAALLESMVDGRP